MLGMQELGEAEAEWRELRHERCPSARECLEGVEEHLAAQWQPAGAAEDQNT